jgi:hypothetical protein
LFIFDVTKKYCAMKKIIISTLILSLFLFIVSCTNEKGPIPVLKSTCDSVIHYSATIVPILTANCTIHGCHNAGATYDYTTYAGIDLYAQPGGILWNRVVNLKNMPASGALSDSDRGKINCWIQQGAPDN